MPMRRASPSKRAEPAASAASSSRVQRSPMMSRTGMTRLARMWRAASAARSASAASLSCFRRAIRVSRSCLGQFAKVSHQKPPDNGNKRRRQGSARIAELLQQLVNGLAVGAIYGLTALGFVLIYKATEIVNFAQGDLLMLGAFIAWTLIVPLGLPYVLAFALTVVAMAAVGAGLDRFVMRSIIGQPHFASIMLTIGLAFSIRGMTSLVWGPEERGL